MSMLNEIFFRRFTTEELKLLKAQIEAVREEREGRFPDRVDDSEVSVRCKRILQAAEIHSWGQLAEYTECEMRRMKNLGTKTIKEIYMELEKRGLKLKS